MKTIKIANREVPVIYETEVVVVGGGPGGIGAALASARTGESTILLEKSNRLGGIGSLGLSVGFFCVDFDVQGGIFKEINVELKKRGAIFSETYQHYGYDKEIYRRLLEEMMMKAGVKLLYDAKAIDVIKEGNAVKGVIIDTDSDGTYAIQAKVVVDCTKYANMAMKAGADLLHYENMPVVSVIFIRDVDFGRLLQEQNENPDWVDITKAWDLPETHGSTPEGKKMPWWPWNLIGGSEGIQKARDRGEIKFDGKIGICIFAVQGPGRVLAYIYSDHIGKTWEYDYLSKAELKMKEQQWVTFNWLKKNVPGFENSMIEETAHEASTFTTHIQGDYIFKAKDGYEGFTAEDSILVCTSQFDPPTGNRRLDIPLYEIPYRCMYSKNIDNLMSGGIDFSCDADATWFTWGNPICMGNGQASGTAAAIAAKKGITPKQIDVKELLVANLF
ncbi:MAG: FAD-dependent oxidoreductase, partial [Actinobacteria bacterium]|nr:FAD-dependent oxidoreductase [Actinomycetota bacterium]